MNKFKSKKFKVGNSTKSVAGSLAMFVVTLILTLVVAYKAIMGHMDIEQIYLMIIAFYFGTQLKESKGE